MLDRFATLFSMAVLIDLSILVVALTLAVHGVFRAKAYFLLTYALTAIYSDYGTLMVKLDKNFGRDGNLWHRVTLPADINYLLDLSGRLALLIVIWLFLIRLWKTRTETDRI